MTSSHTPGPWRFEIDGTIRSPSFGGAQMADYRGSIICDLKPAVGIEDWTKPVARRHAIPEAQANAHLIAAAPELLQALQLVTPILESLNGKCTGDTAMIARIRAAIAKATGEEEMEHR